MTDSSLNVQTPDWSSVEEHKHRSGERFDLLVAAMQTRLNAALDVHGPASLFYVETTQPDLFMLYLTQLPLSEAQHHNCNACRHFFQRYGALAVIGTDGQQRSLWPSAVPLEYAAAMSALDAVIRTGRVVSPAFFSQDVLGTPVTGEWTHFALRLPEQTRYHGTLTASQAMAQKREDYATLRRGLAEYSLAIVEQALTLLETDSLYRAEHVIGPARFLKRLHEMRRSGPAGRQRHDNLVWREVTTAPPGFCTPRSTMIGTLLDDLKSGLSFDAVKRRFAEKMHPLQYQRPQAAPTTGNIAQAEKKVAALGLEPALHRRFARLDEVPKVWEQFVPEQQPQSGTVFGHLKPKGRDIDPSPLVMNTAVPITWAKFSATVLPLAQKIEAFMHETMNFCGVVTAVHPDAPRLLQWDIGPQRNPASWYVYNGGSQPYQWSLTPRAWVNVPAVILQPSLWYDTERFLQHGRSVIFVLEGAKDQRNGGLGLFPEILRSDLHDVRATIGAYSRMGKLEETEGQLANGLRVAGGGSTPNTLRVTLTSGVVARYTIDRWD